MATTQDGGYQKGLDYESENYGDETDRERIGDCPGGGGDAGAPLEGREREAQKPAPRENPETEVRHRGRGAVGSDIGKGARHERNRGHFTGRKRQRF